MNELSSMHCFRLACSLARCFLIAVISIAHPVIFAAELKGNWLPLAEDELHDVTNPAIGLLMEPGEALSHLPFDYPGNQVHWVRALSDGAINPRTNLFPETIVNVIDLDILMGNTGEMAIVRFPHRQHTEWLDCKNCHPKFFKAEVDANPINMMEILMGEHCGRCHGAVAFPLTECDRCHSVPRKTFTGHLGSQFPDGKTVEDYQVDDFQ